MKKHILILTLALSFLLSGCGKQTAHVSGFNPEEGLILTGNVETQETDLNTKIPGKISKLYVEEGMEIKAGYLIAEIDNTQLLAKKAQIEAKVQMAKEAVELQKRIVDSNIKQASGAYKAAQAQLDKAHQGARNQELEQAKIYYEMMQKTYERVEKLYEKGAIAAQKKDEAEAQLKIAEQTYSLAQEGAQKQDITAAEGLVDKASGALIAANASKMQIQLAEQQYQEALAGLAEIESLIADTKIIAPKDGTVVEVNCAESELVSTGMPIVTIADLSNLELSLQVLESDLTQVKLGQKVRVKFIGTGEQLFEGTIKRISSKPGFATQKATNNQDSDVLAYEVKVEMENLENVEVYPGMTAYVQIAQSI